MTNLADAGRSTTFRWALSIAGALLLQTAAVGGVFWWQTARHSLQLIDAELVDSCNQFSPLDRNRLIDNIADENSEDTHRTGYIGLFDEKGGVISGDVLSLPNALRFAKARTPIDVDLRRAEPLEIIPNPSRAIVCPITFAGILVVGRDLKEQTYIRRLSERAILFLALPATFLAICVGFLLSLEGQRRFSRVSSAIAAVLGGDMKVRLPLRYTQDPFDRLCRDVNGMLDFLKELTDDLRGLGDDIAHELRTPLTRLRARLERGCRDAATPAEFQEIGDTSIREIDQALGIISAILRIRASDEDHRGSAFLAVDLKVLIQDAVDLYAPVAETRNVTLTADLAESFWVRADRDLMMEAVANLIDNSIKFTEVGGWVEAGLIGYPDKVVIQVRDDGPGIDPAEIDLVTSKFVRGHSAHQAEGHGIGLSLVKAIVKLHAFSLTIDQVESGCQISICCPRDNT